VLWIFDPSKFSVFLTIHVVACCRSSNSLVRIWKVYENKVNITVIFLCLTVWEAKFCAYRFECFDVKSLNLFNFKLRFRESVALYCCRMLFIACRALYENPKDCMAAWYS